MKAKHACSSGRRHPSLFCKSRHQGTDVHVSRRRRLAGPELLEDRRLLSIGPFPSPLRAVDPLGSLVYIETHKTEKYGRWLADLWHLAGATDPAIIRGQGLWLNRELVVQGLAVLYDGTGPRS